MRLGIGLVFSLAAVLLAVSPAGALDEKFCKDYAERATMAFRKAQGAGCATDGARWSRNNGDHFNWCRAISNRAVADEETAVREDRASQCAVCRSFSNLAAKALDENQKLCRFEEPYQEGWAPTQEAQFNECQRFLRDGEGSAKSKSDNFIVGRTNNLFGDIANCKADRQTPPGPSANPERGYCQQYADRAVAAAATAKAAGCNHSDPRWTSTHDQHNRWCNTASRESSENETRVREDRAAQCGYCRVYAKTAGEQAKQNKERNCGQTGDRWTRDENAHFSWCEKQPEGPFGTRNMPSQVAGKNETAARAGAIARCTHWPPPPPKVASTQQGLSSPSGGSNSSVSRTKPITSMTAPPPDFIKLPRRGGSGSGTNLATPGRGQPSGGINTSHGGCNSAMARLSGECAGGGPRGSDSYVHSGSGGRPAGRAPGTAAPSSPASAPTSTPAPTKSFGRSGSGSIDYGFSSPPAPRPVR
jgi:hypothetical protein